MPDDAAPLPPFLDLIDQASCAGDRLAGLRANARMRYLASGWPHARTESWKYTSLNPLAAGQFASTGHGDTPVLPARPAIDGPRLVLVNGVVRPDLSDLGDLGPGVRATRLANGADPDVGALATIIEETDSTDGLPLAALSTATMLDGLVIDIAAGTVVERPLHVISAACGEGVALAPRIVIRAGADSVASVLETHTADGSGFANAVCQVTLGQGAVLGHYRVQDQPDTSFHVGLTEVRAGGRSQYDNFVLSTGSRLARNEIRGRIEGSGAEYRVNGAYLGAGTQHLDTTTFIDHAAPGSTSREVYKGVLTDRARGVFQGKILVRSVAQKTDGYQMNRAMLLSGRAEVDSKPELEIYADDVRCSHGATVGELDPEQVFYLQARGIAREAARRLLVAAYVDEVLDEIRSEPVRQAMGQVARDWLGRVIGMPGEGRS